MYINTGFARHLMGQETLMYGFFVVALLAHSGVTSGSTGGGGEESRPASGPNHVSILF
jgi:hypothetical protein